MASKLVLGVYSSGDAPRGRERNPPLLRPPLVRHLLLHFLSRMFPCSRAPGVLDIHLRCVLGYGAVVCACGGGRVCIAPRHDRVLPVVRNPFGILLLLLIFVLALRLLMAVLAFFRCAACRWT